MFRAVLAVSVAILCAARAEAGDTAKYVVTDLGTLGGDSFATAINNSGTVVGWSRPSNLVTHAFTWQNGVMTDLAPLGASFSEAWDINETGTVVGRFRVGDTGPHGAFLWQAGGAQALSGLRPGDAAAYAVNDNGQVAGTAGGRGFRWEGGAALVMPTFGGTESQAFGMNQSGTVSGYALNRFGEFVAAQWDGTVLTGWDGFFPASAAYDINDAGDAVGFVDNEGQRRAALFTGGQVIQLGTVNGLPGSPASAINSLGQIVGSLNISTPPMAWIYDPAINPTGLTDLNTLIDPASGWQLRGASDINDLGQIVGYGLNPQGQGHAFLLTVVPSPAGALVVVVGSLCSLRRRR